jgi:transposase
VRVPIRSNRLPLRVVFDNPKTVVLSSADANGRPRWNPTPAQVAIDYGFTTEQCTPRPEQKDTVENLVCWVKKSFVRARRLADGARKRCTSCASASWNWAPSARAT